MNHWLTPGEVARQCCVNVQTLRHYERWQLLDLPERTPGNHRMYTGAAVERVLFIRKAQAVGLTLADIRRILDTQRQDVDRCVTAAELLSSRLQVIDSVLERLQAQRKAIVDAIASWTAEQDSGGGAACSGRFCQVIEDCTDFEQHVTGVNGAGP